MLPEKKLRAELIQHRGIDRGAFPVSIYRLGDCDWKIRRDEPLGSIEARLIDYSTKAHEKFFELV